VQRHAFCFLRAGRHGFFTSPPTQFRFVVAMLHVTAVGFVPKFFNLDCTLFHLDALALAIAISQPDAANCSPHIRQTAVRIPPIVTKVAL